MNLPNKERAQAVLDCIRNAKPLSPTTRDIQDATGIPSSSVVFYYLNKLEREGKIKRVRNEKGNTVARGYLLVEDVSVAGSSTSVCGVDEQLPEKPNAV